MLDREWIDNEKRFNKNRQRREQQVDKYAKHEIKRVAKISIETAAIGSLSDFEEEFGWIWKHGVSYNELTDEEKDMRDKWLDTRESILARAANGVKLTLRSIDRAEFKDFQPKKFNTIIKNKNGENDGRQ